MMLLLLVGCLESLLEAPYILTAGLAPVHDLTPAPNGNLFAATEQGIVYIDEAGVSSIQDPFVASAIASHDVRLYALQDGTLHSTALPIVPNAWQTHPTPEGVVDIQTWCGASVLLASAQGLHVWDAQSETLSTLSWGMPAEQVALDAHHPCTTLWVVSQGGVFRVEAQGHQQWLSGAEHIRDVATSQDGAVWIITGQRPALGRVVEGAVDIRARHLGVVHAMWFGEGGVWSPENVYLASAAGRVDYARVHSVSGTH